MAIVGLDRALDPKIVSHLTLPRGVGRLMNINGDDMAGDDSCPKYLRTLLKQQRRGKGLLPTLLTTWSLQSISVQCPHFTFSFEASASPQALSLPTSTGLF
jgi:hypothetical protein